MFVIISIFSICVIYFTNALTNLIAWHIYVTYFAVILLSCLPAYLYNTNLTIPFGLFIIVFWGMVPFGSLLTIIKFICTRYNEIANLYSIFLIQDLIGVILYVDFVKFLNFWTTPVIITLDKNRQRRSSNNYIINIFGNPAKLATKSISSFLLEHNQRVFDYYQ